MRLMVEHPALMIQLKKADYDAKISDIEKKDFTTSDYNKFTSKLIDIKIKGK